MEDIIKQMQKLPLDKQFKVIRLEQHGFTLVGRGSDRDVYTIPESELVLKTAIGPQIIKTIPHKWKHLYAPYQEFKLPHPVRAGTNDEIRAHKTRTHYWAQIQQKYQLPFINNIYLEDNELDRIVFQACLNKDFVQALLDYFDYSKEDILDLLSNGLIHNVSSRNWGYNKEGQPIIFDYGVIQLEKGE